MIESKDKNLLDKILNLVETSNIWPYGQFRIGNYLINMHRFPNECLVFDDFDNIIDGYSVEPTEFFYQGKSFSSFLENLQII